MCFIRCCTVRNGRITAYNGTYFVFDIPEGITAIGTRAFVYRYGVEKITIPTSVTYIATDAFDEHRALRSIIVKEGNPRFHSSGNCLIKTKQKTLVLGCKTSVIPTDGSVTSIGDRAFYGCISLKSITIPNSVISIGCSAFCRCESLTSITIPDSVTSIDNGAFYGCKRLTSITIPDSVTSIGKYAFSGCKVLKSVTIPHSIEVADNAFDKDIEVIRV